MLRPRPARTRAYEQMLVERIANGLDALGFGWVRIRADGLRLELYGHAPDQFARELALESARATAPLARVTSYATATLAPPEHRDPVRVELHRDSRGVTLTGQTASRAMRERLNAALAEDGPDLAVHDLTGIQAAQPPRGWGPEIPVASLAASRLTNAYVVMEPGSVTIDGQAADEADREALTQALLERAGDRVALVLRIRIPPRVIAPFGFAAYKDAGAGIRLERCAARSFDEQAALLDRLRGAGVEHQPAPCPVGLGGPGGDWTSAVAAGLDALAALPAGRVDIQYRDARLVGAPPTSPAVFEAAQEAFAAALPEGFSATGTLRADDVATMTGIARERFWMHLRRQGQGIVISGLVPDATARTAIETAARALYGSANVASALSLAEAAPPAGWQAGAMEALSLLAEIGQGEAELAGSRLVLRGSVERPGLVRGLDQRLRAALPEHAVETVLTVDLPAALARIPLPPARCVAELNRVNTSPGIDFAMGSAVITEGSDAVLDALASVLSRCAGAPVEIGGHTDSVGSAELNQRLSQARAEAVVEALARRGVPPARMVATGYGEEMPIASNQTESGRAQNRRIAFEPAG